MANRIIEWMLKVRPYSHTVCCFFALRCTDELLHALRKSQYMHSDANMPTTPAVWLRCDRKRSSIVRAAGIRSRQDLLRCRIKFESAQAFSK